ncbi:tetratricopeptide repeat protein [Fibrobacterota bacterium]
MFRGLLFFLLLYHSGWSAGTQVKDHVLEGNALYEKDDYPGAAEQYRQAIEKNKNLPFAWFNLGNCHAQGKKYHEAIVAYRRSIEEAPQFSRPWLLLGDIYYSLDAVGQAVVCFRRVVELEEDNVYAWKWLGESYLRAGDATEAMRCFDAALKLDPDQIDVYFALAETHAGIRDYESAQDILKEAILLSPHAKEDVYFYLGYIYELAGDRTRSVRAYEEGLVVNPGRKDMYMRIARIQQEAGSDFLALLTLEIAVESGIKDAAVHLERGLIFFKQERLERALEEFNLAWQLGSPRGRHGMENISAAYWNRGEKDKANEVLEQMR